MPEETPPQPGQLKITEPLPFFLEVADFNLIMTGLAELKLKDAYGTVQKLQMQMQKGVNDYVQRLNARSPSEGDQPQTDQPAAEDQAASEGQAEPGSETGNDQGEPAQEGQAS